MAAYTVAAALAAAATSSLPSGSVIVDTERNVTDNLDALRGIAGSLSAITLTDPGMVGMAITATQQTSDAAVIALVTNPHYFTLRITAAQAAAPPALPAGFHGYSIIDTAADVVSALPAIEALYKAGTLASVRFTDATPPVLSLSAATVQANIDALDYVNVPYTITLTDSAPPTITIPNWSDETATFIAALAAIKTPFYLDFSGVIRPGAVDISERGISHYSSDNIAIPTDSISPYGTVTAANLPSSLQVMDTTTNLSKYLDTLAVAAAAGKLASVTSLQPGLQLLSITAAQATSDAQALAKFAPDFELSEIITASQAASPPALASGFMNYTVQDTEANILANISAITALATKGELGRLRFANSAPYLSITAAQLSAAALALTYANEYASIPIVLTDSGTPTVTIAGDTWASANMRTLLNWVVGSFHLVITGSISASQAASIVSTGGKAYTDLTSVAVTDSSGNIVSNIGALETLAAAGLLTAINLTDTFVPTLNITGSAVTADAAVLALIKTPYNLVTAYSNTSIVTSLASLETALLSNTLGNITISGSGTQAISVTATQLSQYIGVFGKITSNNYSITLSSGTSVTLAPWQVTSNNLTVLTKISGSYSFSISGPVNAYDAATLNSSSAVGNFSVVPGLTVVDYAGNVAANLAALSTLAGSAKLSGITLLDGFSPGNPVALAITSAQYSAGSLALSYISAATPHVLALAVTASAAATTTLPSGFSELVVQDSLSNVVANASALETLYLAGKLNGISYTSNGPLNISAATLTANIDVFALGNNYSSITLSDSGTPTISIPGVKLNNYSILNLLNQISSPFNFALTGPVTANDISNLSVNASGVLAKLGTINITDTSYDVAFNIGLLQTLVNEGKLGTITLTDGGVPNLNIGGSTAAADAGALAKIITPYTTSNTTQTPESLNPASGTFASDLAALETMAQANTLGGVTLTGASNPTLSLSSSQVAQNLAALGQIGASYSISLTDGGTPNLTLQAWQTTGQMLAALSHITSPFTFSISGPISSYSASALTSSGELSHLSGTVSITDYSNSISSNLDALQTLAASGHLGTVTPSDYGNASIYMTASQATNDTGALAAISGPFARSLSIGASAASATPPPAGFSSYTVVDSLSDVLANLALIEPLATSSWLASIQITTGGPYSFSLSAATLSSNLYTLAMIGNSTITLTDSGTPTIYVAGTALGDYQIPNLLNSISGSFNISVTGPVSAWQTQNILNNTSLVNHLTSFTVTDNSGAIASNIDNLQVLAAKGLLSAINITDSGVPTLNISATQQTNDAGALALISGPYVVSTGYSAASFVTNLTSLETAAQNGTLGGFALTDAGTPTISLSAAQLTAGLYAASYVYSSYTISLTDSATPNLTLQPWQVTSSMLGVLTKITSPFTFSISGTLTGSEATALADSSVLSKLTGPVSFVDSSGNFGGNNIANLNAVQAISGAGHSVSISFLPGGGLNVLYLTAGSISSDANALAAITTPYSTSLLVSAANAATTSVPQTVGGTIFNSMTVQDSVANITANLSALEALAVNGQLTNIVLTGSSPYVFNLSAAQVGADADALLKINGGYTITLTDGGTPTITLQNSQLSSNIATLLNDITSPYALAINGIIRPSTAVTLANAGATDYNRIVANSLQIRDYPTNYINANANNMTGLLTLANAGKIASLDLRDQNQALSLTTAQATTYAPLVALIDSPSTLSQVITAAQAGAPPALATGFSTYTVQDTVANILTNLTAIETLAANNQLGRLQFTDPAPVLTLSAAQLMAGALAFAYEDYAAYPVVLTDSGTPTITLNSTELSFYNLRNDILDTIVGPWSLVVSGAASAGTMALIAEENNGVLAHLAGPVAVSDYSYDVQDYLDQLAYLANLGKISSITLEDGGTPTISLTAAQETQDAVLFSGIIQGSYTLNVVPQSVTSLDIITPSVFQWNTGSGSWGTSADWTNTTVGNTNAGPPGSQDSAVFAGGNGTVTGTGSLNNLTIDGGTQQWAFAGVALSVAGNLIAGNTAYGEGNFANSSVLSVGGQVIVGNSAGSTGALLFSGGSVLTDTEAAQTASPVFVVGNSQGGSSPPAPNSSGGVLVTGAGSEINLGSNQLAVGYNGTGQMSIQNGGLVRAGTTNSAQLLALIIGDNNSGSLNVQDTGSSLQVTGGVGIGVAGGGNGQLDLQGGASMTVVLDATGGDGVAVGADTASGDDGGIGQLDVDGSGTSLSIATNGSTTGSGALVVGYGESTGFASVSDSASIDVQGQLLIGDGKVYGGGTYSGTGTLDISSSGTVEVDGIGASVSTAIIVGNIAGDSGTLQISSGGVLNYTAPGEGVGYAMIISNGAAGGGSLASNGVVSVSGSGSVLNMENNGIAVGWNGTGQLSITQGGVVDAATIDSLSTGATSLASLAIGRYGNSTVIVSDAGSKLNLAGSAYVARGSDSTLSVLNGGVVNITDDPSGGSGLSIGVGNPSSSLAQTGGMGVVTVSGSNAQLTVAGGNASLVSSVATTTGNITVGGNGDAGTLNVANTGTVTADQRLVVGNDTVAGGLTYHGIGTVNIGSGGAVDVLGTNVTTGLAAILIASGAGDVGTINVDGGGAVLNSTVQAITIGSGGSGAVNVLNGGTVSAGTSFTANAATLIGNASGGTGTLTVSGGASKYTAVGQMVVGASGTGTLLVSGGGAVYTGDDTATGFTSQGLVAGLNSGGFGSVTITGGGSTLHNVGRFDIGGQDGQTIGGIGSLLISSGAQVTTSLSGSSTATPAVSIGATAGSGGSNATVTGTGSTLAVTGALDVALGANAALSVLAGGFVSGGTVDLGTSSGDVANVTLENTGSELLATAAMTIGDAGTADVTINGGTLQSNGNMTLAAQIGSFALVDMSVGGGLLSAAGPIDIGASSSARVLLGSGSTVSASGGISIGTSGVAVMSGGTLGTPGATVLNGGLIQGIGFVDNTAVAPGVAAITNNGVIDALGGFLGIGNVQGSGLLEIGADAGLAVGGSVSGNAIVFGGPSGQLKVFEAGALNPTSITGFAVGDAIDFVNAKIDAVTYQSGVATLYDAGSVVASFDLSSSAQYLTLASDGSTGTLLQASATAPLSESPSQGPDFNGDGTSDLIWQAADGTPIIWQMNNLAPTAYSGFSSPGTSWHVMGTGDFYGTGDSDILWQNDDGAVAIWEMSGTSLIGGGTLSINPGTAWHIVGTGDFNGDGHSDILWQNNDGQAAIWFMDGSTLLSGENIFAPAGWKAIGTGEFGNNGQSDIVWQASDGSAVIWLLNNGAYASSIDLGNPGQSWHIVGTGDFNGDGKSDLLWQNDDGAVSVWLMAGGGTIASTVVANPGPAWHAIGTGDYTGTGTSDILFQNNDGNTYIWQMNGLNLVGGTSPGDFGTGFSLLGQSMMRFISGDAGGTFTASLAPTDFDASSLAASTNLTINNFTPLTDVLTLNGATFSSLAAVEAAASNSGGNVVINLGGGASVTLAGLNTSQLYGFDFRLT